MIFAVKYCFVSLLSRYHWNRTVTKVHYFLKNATATAPGPAWVPMTEPMVA
jgi:hypothetical protein